jgi:hypothetical protein
MSMLARDASAMAEGKKRRREASGGSMTRRTAGA